MTIFARSLWALPPRRSILPRAHLLTAAVAACLMCAFVFAAAPAGAVVTEVGSTGVGLQPRDTNLTEGQFSQQLGEVVFNPAESFDNAAGNPVLHSTNTYAVYWDPTAHYHGDWQHLINGFLRDTGTASGSLSSVFAVDTQYTDRSNVPATAQTTFRGAYTDTHPYPAPVCTDPHPLTPSDRIACITDAQLREELSSFITQHGLTKGMGTIFYLMTPPGVTVCVDAAATHCSDFSRSVAEENEGKFESESYKNSFCSYHSAINPGESASGDANSVLYAAIPWTAGGLGDLHLASLDRTPAFDCQDGGYDPSSKPIEKAEKAKVKTVAEEEAFEAMSAEEKQKAEEAEVREGRHQEEPNQGTCPSTDGTCDTGLADLIINQIGVEQQNTVTNPLLNAWQDSASKELTDECRNFFALIRGGSVTASELTGAGSLSNQELASGHYYLNDAFNLASFRLPYPGAPCQNNVSLDPKFTAPNTVNAGDVVGFDGMESDITLGAAIGFSGGGVPQPNYATYSWDFGDGSALVRGYAPGAPACETPWLTPCAASEFHSYLYGGTYRVTLTVRDVGGNTAAFTQAITVVGAGPPAKELASTQAAGTTGGGTTGGGTTGGGSAAAPTSTGSAPVPPPVAAAAVVSRSLKLVLRKGLVVRYSVNEQVAGHFDVMLSQTIAHHLGITGTPAVGLAAGTPAQLIIAKAILVTTKGGRSTVTIQFSRRTAARLARLHKVTLTVRLIVHNAASHTPLSVTVLSTVTLSH